MNNWPNPFIEQRADPFILRHHDSYYFIASVPEYDRLEIRRAATLEGLREAEPVTVWRKPQSGPDEPADLGTGAPLHRRQVVYLFRRRPDP